MKPIKIILTGSFLLAALNFSTPAFAAIQVYLEVDAGSGSPALKVKTNDAQCPGGPLNCISVKKGDKPDMFFNLKNACKSGGPAYRLTKFRITEKNKVWPTPSNPMNQKVAKDFCADRNTGYVDFNYCRNQQKDDKLKLKNFNATPATVYYEITAESCSGSGGAIYLDPQIRNTGGF